jgi:hypothetical protein
MSCHVEWDGETLWTFPALIWGKMARQLWNELEQGLAPRGIRGVAARHEVFMELLRMLAVNQRFTPDGVYPNARVLRLFGVDVYSAQLPPQTAYHWYSITNV